VQALLDHILTERSVEQALVFTSTQRDADWLADRLADMGHAVASLHGGMPQGRRNRVLQGLRSRHLKVLVATDVAARGIDVPSISHVINYGLPMKAEDYVHRIGRTGRAGRNGLAITLAEAPDAGMIRRIQQFTTQDIPVAVIDGLEPTKPSPRLFAPRREGFGGGKPFNGPKKGFKSGGGYGAKKPFHARQGDAPFQPRGDSPFAGDRNGGDRGGFNADRGRGPFERKPAGFAPAGKPQRPRQGGWSR
jgi:superfamily II DNA/RNA helicase